MGAPPSKRRRVVTFCLDFVHASFRGDGRPLATVLALSSPDASAKGRLLRRAQLVARLQHPNLTRMLPLPGGAGLAPVLNDARPLWDFGRGGAPFRRFELEHTIQIVLDVLNGLSALHEVAAGGAGFVHGAVSPHSICIEASGSARLIPLSNAHFTPGVAVEMTGYVAPEYLLGEAVDCRADLFSVGVLLWEAIAGRRLFSDGSAAAVKAALGSGAAAQLAPAEDATWALGLCPVAQRALSAEPAARFASASELSQAIVAAGGPRLTRRHDWQDEAPTLEHRKRREPVSLRHATPPATSVDIVVEVMEAAGAPAPPAAPPVSDAADELELPPLPRKPRRRAYLLGAGAATFVALLGLLALRRTALEPATAARPVAAMATLAPPPSVAPLLASSAAPAASSAAPVASHVPAPSARPPAVKRAPLKRRSSPPAGSRSDSDYGI